MSDIEREAFESRVIKQRSYSNERNVAGLYVQPGLEQAWRNFQMGYRAAPQPGTVATPKGWLVRRADDRITVQHPDFGGYCASKESDDRSAIAPVILYHFADAILKAALNQEPQP